MTTFQFQTYVSDNGAMTLPPLPEMFYGEHVTIKVDMNDQQKPKSSFEALCDAWCADERSTEEIIRDIYDSRTLGRERDPL